MARTLAELPAGSRITDFIGLGVVARFFPVEKIHDVLEQTKRASVRERDLPAHVVVYYVIALALYMRSSYGARKADEDPDRLSFLHSVRVVQRRMARHAAIPPSAEKSLPRSDPRRNS